MAFEANIGSTSGLGGFATAMPGAIDEWIRQNEAQRQMEAEGRLQQALAPFKGQKANMLSQAIAGFQSGQPLNEMQRSSLGLKGRDPQVVMNDKILFEQIKQAGLLEKGQQLIEAHEGSSRRLQEDRAAMQGQKPPTQSQVLGSILQAEIEGKATPGMKQAWRMAHPLEGQIVDRVERELLHSDAYKMAVASGDVATATKLRQETMDRMMTFMGMNPSQEQEEAYAAEENEPPAGPSQSQGFMNDFLKLFMTQPVEK
jgi:hypothetical protein